MRKRIIIGLLALVVVTGMGAFFVSQPERGTVEWHKREYLASVDRIYGDAFLMRIRRIYSPPSMNDAGAMRRHKEALIDLGWMQRREFVISHWTKRMRLVVAQLNPQKGKNPYTEASIELRDGPLRVLVTALAAEMPRWEKLIREADVPEVVAE